MNQIMLDNETLAVTADAIILSIGAVKFDINTGEIDDAGFYVSISVESNLALGRRMDESTLIWWFKQDAAAQQVFLEPKETLPSALLQLSDWIGDGKYDVWSLGADFDIPMLAHAYRQCMVELPWLPRRARCVRTYKNLPGAERVPVPAFEGVKHNALADAHHQAAYVSAIHRALFLNEEMKA